MPSFSRDTARSSAQQAIYDLGKVVVLTFWLTYGAPQVSRLAKAYLGMTARAALAWALVLSVVVVFIGLFIYEWWKESRDGAGFVADWKGATPTKTRHKKKYRNMEVEIDGSAFDRCRFDNVTLNYRGVAGTSFNACQFHGSIVVQTHHPAVQGFIHVTEALKHLPGTKFRLMQKSTIDGEVTPLDPPIIMTGVAPY